MNTSKNTTGILHQAIIAGLAVIFLTPVSFAAQSTSYSIDTETPNQSEHAAGTSPSYQLNGGITWRQTAPLASNSFQIVPNAAAATSTAPAPTPTPVPSTTGGTPTGGHRGSTSSIAGGLHPAASSQPSSRSSVRTSRASIAATSVSSVVSTVTVSSQSSAASIAGAMIVAPSAECPGQSAITLYRACTVLLSTISSGNGIFTLKDVEAVFLFGLALGLLIGILIALALRLCMQPARRRKKVSQSGRTAVRIVLLIAFALAAASLAITYQAHAAETTPNRYIYNGHLLDSAGRPITTAHSIRFSFWKSADLQASDITGAGAIDTAAATYAGWTEVDTITPDASGYFSVQLGAGTPLPSLAGFTDAEIQSLFLQVEVKAQPAADTAYEVLDTDPIDPAVDRSPILSVPFAHNTDTIDHREIGTGSGSIPLLGPNGQLPSAAIPSNLNGTSLVLDSTNSATGSINLQFGATLAKTLSYDTVNARFNFNDSVRIQGNLTVLGLINGVDISALSGGADTLHVGSGGGLNITVTGGNYRLNGTDVAFAGSSNTVMANATNYVFFGSGGITVRTMPFPTDESFIPLAEVVTGGSAINYIVDRRQKLTDDREEAVETTLHPQYADASYSADGVDNVGQLSVVNDPVTLKNSYLWTSTRSTLQDYDVVLRLTLPTQFTHWKVSPISFLYKSSSADSSVTKMDVSVYDTAGNPVTLTGTSTNLANTSWTTQTLDFSGTPTWTPGGTVGIRLKLSAKDNGQIQLGDLLTKYVKLTGN